jgi:excisionase family DNA binding protein
VETFSLTLCRARGRHGDRHRNYVKGESNVLHTKPAEQRTTELLTRQELCSRLKLSKRTISRLLSCGKLPPAVRLGHSVRWRADEIDQWIDRGCPAVDRNGKSQ